MDRSDNNYGKQDEEESSWRHERHHPNNKIPFPTFSDGGPQG